jgi:hypothetical protein
VHWYLPYRFPFAGGKCSLYNSLHWLINSYTLKINLDKPKNYKPHKQIEREDGHY